MNSQVVGGRSFAFIFTINKIPTIEAQVCKGTSQCLFSETFSFLDGDFDSLKEAINVCKGNLNSFLSERLINKREQDQAFINIIKAPRLDDTEAGVPVPVNEGCLDHSTIMPNSSEETQERPSRQKEKNL